MSIPYLFHSHGFGLFGICILLKDSNYNEAAILLAKLFNVLRTF